MATTLTFGGHDIAGYLVGLSIERSVMPPVEVQTVDIPGADGLLFAGRRLKPLEITVRGALAADSASEVANARHALGAILNTPGTARLVMPDEPGLYYNALVSGSTELDRAYERPSFSVTFTVPEACAWSSEERSATLPSGRSTYVDVGGNAQTWPTLTIVPDSADCFLNVRRLATQHDPRIVEYRPTGFAAGSAITIDMSARTTTQGATELFPDLRWDYFPIGPEQTGVSVVGASGTIKWRERWI